MIETQLAVPEGEKRLLVARAGARTGKGSYVASLASRPRLAGKLSVIFAAITTAQQEQAPRQLLPNE